MVALFLPLIHEHTDVTDLESEQIPSSTPTPTSAPETNVTLPISRRRLRVLALAAGVLSAIVVLSSIVYLRPPTNGTVRAIVGVLPYPAAVIGTDVITINEYLEERDALDAYFQTSAGETGTVPSEEEITQNIMETLVHKSAVNHLAEASGMTLDESRVDAFYEQAVGGADQEQFAAQLDSMFGWTVDEFRDRVVRPVVLAMQLGEQIEGDASLQDARRQKAQAAYDRLVAGDDFAVVAGDASADFSAAGGGDVGYVKMSEIPQEWTGTISQLETGSYSEVVEGIESFLIFRVTDRVEAGEDTEVKLSIISVQKVTLEEAVQEYLDSTRVWKLIGRT